MVLKVLISRKTLNNNDLHQVEPAVLDLTRGLSPQNTLEDHQIGGDVASSVVFFNLPLSIGLKSCILSESEMV